VNRLSAIQAHALTTPDGVSLPLTFNRDIPFLLGTEYAPKLWRPVLRGDAVTGDIIAPIRKLGEAKRKATCQDAADVAEALFEIPNLFYAEASKAEVLTERTRPIPSIKKAVGHPLRSHYTNLRSDGSRFCLSAITGIGTTVNAKELLNVQ
jgi:hypothetical protein